MSYRDDVKIWSREALHSVSSHPHSITKAVNKIVCVHVTICMLLIDSWCTHDNSCLRLMNLPGNLGFITVAKRGCLIECCVYIIILASTLEGASNNDITIVTILRWEHPYLLHVYYTSSLIKYKLRYYSKHTLAFLFDFEFRLRAINWSTFV